jgi:hypothetical protein
MRSVAQKQNQPEKPESSSLARSHSVTLGVHHHVQPKVGNQAATPSPYCRHDFSRIPLHAPTGGGIRTKLATNTPGDEYEQEADRVAERVMNIATPQIDGSNAGQRLKRLQDGSQGGGGGGGNPLPDDVRRVMELRFGFDFSQVRTHTDLDAVRMSHKLNAQAFTYQEHIYYGSGKSPGTNALTAHELTHVVQQAGGPKPAAAPVGTLQGQPAHVPSIQRVLEVRPPGRGEGSAFERRQELIDRLNAQSAAIQYRLDGRQIRYDVIDEAALTNFDRQMRAFIDRPELVPMRLTTGANLVGNPAGPFRTLLGDSLRAAYVDLDDIMADDEFSFRSDLVHFLTERFSVRNYARRIGAEQADPAFITQAEFERGHQLGKNAEAALLQEFFNDPSIQFNYEETLPNGSWLNNFTSRNHGYQVFQVVRGTSREIAGGEMFVRTRDGRRVTMDEFRAERAAAALVAP